MKVISSIAVILLLSLFTIQSAAANSVVLNELMPHPSPGSDWVELYNPSSDSIDLSNWILVDSTSTMKTLSGTIAANGFTTFDVTNRLNNSGDSIYLKDPSSNIIDSYSYDSDPGINKSIGRSPDGGSWTILTSNSKGSSNGEQSSSTPSLTPTPTPSPIPTPSPSPTPTKTPSPTATPKKTATPTNAPISTPNPTLKNTPIPSSSKTESSSESNGSREINYRIASVAAVSVSATTEGKVEVKNEKQINPFLWIGIIFIFAGAGAIGYIYLKKNAKI